MLEERWTLIRCRRPNAVRQVCLLDNLSRASIGSARGCYKSLPASLMTNYSFPNRKRRARGHTPPAQQDLEKRDHLDRFDEAVVEAGLGRASLRPILATRGESAPPPASRARGVLGPPSRAGKRPVRLPWSWADWLTARSFPASAVPHPVPHLVSGTWWNWTEAFGELRFRSGRRRRSNRPFCFLPGIPEGLRG